MIEGTTREGKKIAVGTGSETDVTAAGSVGHTIRIVELSVVEAVLQINVKTSPTVQVSIPQNLDIDGNLISFTLTYGAATTVTPEAVAIGR